MPQIATDTIFSGPFTLLPAEGGIRPDVYVGLIAALASLPDPIRPPPLAAGGWGQRRRK
jgi:hypothetical protein